MYGCAFENVFTTSFSIAYTTCHLQGMKHETDSSLAVGFHKLVQFQIHPPLNILTVPDWLNFKFHYFPVGPKVKILGTLTPLAPIYVTSFPGNPARVLLAPLNV